MAPDRGRVGAFGALVSGRVQGVGFRYSACREARLHRLTGWVRNLDSGEVEAWCEGDPSDLDDFALWLKQGPDGACVSNCRIIKEEPTGRYGGFSIVV